MGIITWFHKRKFNKIKKQLDQAIIKSYDVKGEQVNIYFNQYFRLAFKEDRFAPDCDQIQLYWLGINPESTIEMMLRMNKYINCTESINWTFCSGNTKRKIAELLDDAIGHFEYFMLYKEELMKHDYLINYNLYAHFSKSKTSDYVIKVKLTPYLIAGYIEDIKKFYINNKQYTEDIIEKYKEYCLTEFANYKRVTADEPLLEIPTIESWFNDIYIPKVELEARNKECQKTLEEIKKIQEKKNK